MKKLKYTMTREHENWNEFINQLSGPAWDCRHDHRHAIEALVILGADVDSSLEYLEKHGGYCDCEIMLNVAI